MLLNNCQAKIQMYKIIITIWSTEHLNFTNLIHLLRFIMNHPNLSDATIGFVSSLFFTLLTCKKSLVKISNVLNLHIKLYQIIYTFTGKCKWRFYTYILCIKTGALRVQKLNRDYFINFEGQTEVLQQKVFNDE